MTISSDTSNACNDNRLKETESHLKFKYDKKVIGQDNVQKNLRSK